MIFPENQNFKITSLSKMNPTFQSVVTGSTCNQCYTSQEGNMIVQTQYHANGKIKCIFRSLDNKPHGIQQVWNVNGNLSDVTDFTKGLKNGSQEQWYPSGKIKGIFNYVNGIFQGKQEEWHENGKISKISNVVNDKLHGKQEHWSVDGKIQKIYNIINGNYEGKQETFYPSGKIHHTNFFINGKKHGDQETRYESGLMKHICYYENGNEGVGYTYPDNMEVFKQPLLPLPRNVYNEQPQINLVNKEENKEENKEVMNELNESKEEMKPIDFIDLSDDESKEVEPLSHSMIEQVKQPQPGKCHSVLGKGPNKGDFCPNNISPECESNKYCGNHLSWIRRAVQKVDKSLVIPKHLQCQSIIQQGPREGSNCTRPKKGSSLFCGHHKDQRYNPY